MGVLTTYISKGSKKSKKKQRRKEEGWRVEGGEQKDLVCPIKLSGSGNEGDGGIVRPNPALFTSQILSTIKTWPK